MRKSDFYLLCLIVVLLGCGKDIDQDEALDERKYREDIGILFDSTPVNFRELNSEFDDYNSAYPPGLWKTGFSIVFSTNRNSEGEHFDFLNYFVDFLYDYSKDSIIRVQTYERSEFYDWDVTAHVNSTNNELGPFYWNPLILNNKIQTYTFLYSSDCSGNHDVMLLFHDTDSVIGSDSLPNINTPSNENYPCIRKGKFYFSSDRSGVYDLYVTDLIDSDFFETHSIEFSAGVKVMENLSSEYDDKCPFVKDSILIFTSNREGGYGGYDLYYSEKTDFGWSDPINFGENINTEYDEYRPIIVPLLESENTLMIFSSNRAGGKGGFDLYFVGIDRKNDLGLNRWDW